MTFVPDNERKMLFPRSSLNSSLKKSVDFGNASWNVAQIACAKQSGYTYQKQSHIEIIPYFI